MTRIREEEEEEEATKMAWPWNRG